VGFDVHQLGERSAGLRGDDLVSEAAARGDDAGADDDSFRAGRGLVVSAGHTPGPWIAKASEAYAESTGKTVARCDIGGRDDETDANARLAAAAPEMLATLEQIAKDDAEGNLFLDVPAVRYVIAKARGIA
jgi:hypothetical protein